MRPFLPKPAHAILRCPNCQGDLSPADHSLVCGRGHRFDLSREGYVNLLTGRGVHPTAGGDTRQQLERRGGRFED
jgi:23S rRNA (guanine745-N1)-methyltransferase